MEAGACVGVGVCVCVCVCVRLGVGGGVGPWRGACVCGGDGWKQVRVCVRVCVRVGGWVGGWVPMGIARLTCPKGMSGWHDNLYRDPLQELCVSLLYVGVRVWVGGGGVGVGVGVGVWVWVWVCVPSALLRLQHSLQL